VLLYVYCVFDPISEVEVDPIVAGVAFKRTSGGILVRGDVCGEESGRVYLELPEYGEIVPETGTAVIQAASRTAARLSREVDAVLRALDHTEPA
jgi:hypothetical protein